MYDPSLGARFLTRDPLEAITRSPYGYALNNPVNYIDPSGLIGLPIHLPSLGELWHGFADQIGCGFQQVAGFAWEHRVGILQGLSIVAAAGAIALAPEVVMFSLMDYSVLSPYLAVISIELNALAASEDQAPGRRDRIVDAVLTGLAGLGMGGFLRITGAPQVVSWGGAALVDLAGTFK